MPLLPRIPAPAMWDTSTVQQLLANETNPIIKDNARFIAGDHWLEGRGWRGPNAGDDEHATSILKSGFVSRNVILEVCRRHAEGVVGNEPDWGLVSNQRTTKPTKAVIELIAEVEDALTDWWDEHDALDELAMAVEQTTWAKRGTLRLFIPAGLMPVGGELPRATTLDDALQYIYLESIPYDQGLVYTDPSTKRQVGALVFQDENGVPVLEWTWLQDPSNPRSPAFIAQRRQGAATPTPFKLDLQGRLPIMEIRVRRLLSTVQLQDIQKVMNLALSVVPRNIITSGFLERIFLNAQMPGTWEKDDQGRKTRFVPGPYQTGPNTTSFVQGTEVTDEVTGQTRSGNAQVVFREPTPVTGTVEAKHSAYEDALEETDQVHILIEGAATPSGVSRQEARSGYARSLRRTQRPTQRTGRNLVMGVLAFAEAIMRQPGKYTGQLRSRFDCRLDLGPTSPDDQRVAAELYESDLLSEATAMVRLDIQDPDAEAARRNASPRGRLDLKTKQLTALAEGTKIPTATIEGVAKFIGLTDEEVSNLQMGTPAAPKNVQGNPIDPNAPPPPPPGTPGAVPPTAANAIPGIPGGPIQQ